MAIVILRRRVVEARTGKTHSTLYKDISEGLFPKPVSIGDRAVGWPDYEVEAVNAARIAGKTKSELRKLVADLEAERTAVAEGLTWMRL